MHEGFADSWYDREWFAPYDDDYRNLMVEGFEEFSEDDRFQNSIDFNRWFFSSGMAEFVIERGRQDKGLRAFQKAESFQAKRSRATAFRASPRSPSPRS